MPFHVLQTLTSYDLKLFNRDQSDVRRGLEERIRLTLAMETGDGSLIASAITHRKQGLRLVESTLLSRAPLCLALPHGQPRWRAQEEVVADHQATGP